MGGLCPAAPGVPCRLWFPLWPVGGGTSPILSFLVTSTTATGITPQAGFFPPLRMRLGTGEMSTGGPWTCWPSCDLNWGPDSVIRPPNDVGVVMLLGVFSYLGYPLDSLGVVLP